MLRQVQMKVSYCRGHPTDTYKHACMDLRCCTYTCTCTIPSPPPHAHTHTPTYPPTHSLAVSDDWVLSQHGAHGGHLISNPLGHFLLAGRRSRRVEVTKGTRIVQCEDIGFVWQKGHVGFFDGGYLCDRGNGEVNTGNYTMYILYQPACCFSEVKTECY